MDETRLSIFANIKPISIITLSLMFVCSIAAPQDNYLERTVPISGGTFLMGTAESDVSELKQRYQVDFPGVFENETPMYKVTIGDFRIDETEVTNARFFEFLEAVPEWKKARIDVSQHNGKYLAGWQSERYPDGSDNLPVVFVTWSAAQSYCRWRGGRLPTEAEWEYVARSGDNREFPWGDELPTPGLANYSASNIDETVEVGSYAPNDFGVYDLPGNVWEFLLDEWLPNYALAEKTNPISGGSEADSEIENVTGRRAVRGASFGGSVVNLRTRWRDSHVVTNATEFVGFRCAYPEH